MTQDGTAGLGLGRLAAASRDLLAVATTTGLPPAEAVTRATLAADAHRALRELAPLADPYRSGSGHSMTADLVRLSAHGLRGTDVAAEARARLDAYSEARATATETTANVPGLLAYPVAPVNGTGLATSPLLDQVAIATPKRPGTPGLLVPDGWTVGAAEFDPVEGAPDLPDTDVLVVDGENVPWHTGARVVDVSRQVIDWADTSQAELDQAFSASVNIALEAGLVAIIVADGTPAAAGTTLADTLDAAEGAAGAAWPDGSRIITLVNPADLPAVRRAYAGQDAGPLLVPTVGQTAGTVTTFARNAVALYASPLDTASTPRPSLFAVGTYWVRYGLAKVRNPAAVVVAALPAAA